MDNNNSEDTLAARTGTVAIDMVAEDVAPEISVIMLLAAPVAKEIIMEMQQFPILSRDSRIGIIAGRVATTSIMRAKIAITLTLDM